MSYEPRILGFLCNWCSYAGADSAGVSRVQYPPNIRVIRVMCSGRVDPKFVINALKIGIDGVIVMGCHPGDCHYLEGNYEAEKKYDMTEGLLKFVGLDNRIRLEWVSASEGVRFGEVVKDFTDKIRDLGPSPLSGDQVDQNLLDKLIALEKAASSNRLRALVGRQRKITEDENAYGVKFPEERFDEILDQAMKEEYERNRVLVALEKDSKSVKDIAIELDLDSSVVLEHVLTLKARSLVDFEKIIGNTPIFMRM